MDIISLQKIINNRIYHSPEIARQKLLELAQLLSRLGNNNETTVSTVLGNSTISLKQEEKESAIGEILLNIIIIANEEGIDMRRAALEGIRGPYSRDFSKARKTTKPQESVLIPLDLPLADSDFFIVNRSEE